MALPASEKAEASALDEEPDAPMSLWSRAGSSLLLSSCPFGESTGAPSMHTQSPP